MDRVLLLLLGRLRRLVRSLTMRNLMMRRVRMSLLRGSRGGTGGVNEGYSTMRMWS